MKKVLDDTIAAISTALGPSGVGIIRISGPEAGPIADKVFSGKKNIKLSERPAYTITYGKITDEQGCIIDEALALTMWKPRSFTGEDVVELQCHGGMVVLKKTLELVLQAGARLAEPGEFSKRAFLNGRIDLSQAEAIIDIINAKTEKAVQAAANNLQGTIAAQTKKIREMLATLLAYLEADIDFPEEDIERLSAEELTGKLAVVESEIDNLLETYQSGRIMREGLKTVLIGKPNVGKSSILNAILKETRAIVTDIPGTTRDIIEEYYNLGGIPLVLVDTAGLRETQDLVEKLGVEKTREVLKEADLVLYVVDVAEGIDDADLLRVREFSEEKMIVLINKMDLLADDKTEKNIAEKLAGYRVIFMSAKEGTGLRELEKGILEMFFAKGLEINDKPFLTNTRQKDALKKAKEAVLAAKKSISEQLPSDFVSIDIKQAWLMLGEITGETLDENIIDQIFSQFCLGK